MKSKSLSYLLALVMVLTFAGAGCTKNLQKPTPLPSITYKPTGEGPEGGKVPPYNPDEKPEGKEGGFKTADWPIDAFNKDYEAFKNQTVYFDFDSITIKAGELGKVSAVAAVLGGNSNVKLIVEGHCDERGTEEYNRSLGERRALVLREQLAKDGVDPERVQIGRAHV